MPPIPTEREVQLCVEVLKRSIKSIRETRIKANELGFQNLAQHLMLDEERRTEELRRLEGGKNGI